MAMGASDELDELRNELFEARETLASNRETIASLQVQLADAQKPLGDKITEVNMNDEGGKLAVESLR